MSEPSKDSVSVEVQELKRFMGVKGLVLSKSQLGVLASKGCWIEDLFH
jgi:hypothetical protein